MWLTLNCPLCGHPVGETEDHTQGAVRLRCRRKECAKPIVTFTIADGVAIPSALVDRRERKRVG